MITFMASSLPPRGSCPPGDRPAWRVPAPRRDRNIAGPLAPRQGRRVAAARRLTPTLAPGTLSARQRRMLLQPRYLPRLASIVGLFTRYGLADFAKQQGLLELGADPSDEGGEEGAEIAERAAALRKRLVELGPAYIKLGQVLSTRPDLIPQAYIRELERLQDDVNPLPLEQVEQTVEEELG